MKVETVDTEHFAFKYPRLVCIAPYRIELRRAFNYNVRNVDGRKHLVAFDEGMDIHLQFSYSGVSIEGVFFKDENEFDSFSPETRKKFKEFILHIIRTKEVNDEGR